VLTISELARRTGTATSALRFYERKGLLAPAGRAGRVRVYDDSAKDRVAMVNLLQHAGFTLAEIAAFTDAAPATAQDWRGAVYAKLAELDQARAVIDRASAMLRHALECPHSDIGTCPEFIREVRAHAGRLDPDQQSGPGTTASY
jgi:DNA-binding transcriptional MerR regulator